MVGRSDQERTVGSEAFRPSNRSGSVSEVRGIRGLLEKAVRGAISATVGTFRPEQFSVFFRVLGECPTSSTL